MEDLGNEDVHVKVESGVVVPVFITEVDEGTGSGSLTVWGKKTIKEKNPVKIQKSDAKYKIYENCDYIEGWTEVNGVVDIIRKVE